MLETCRRLEIVLNRILNAIIMDQARTLQGLLTERDMLVRRVLKSQPDRDRLKEIGDTLSSIVSLEQTIMHRAGEKRASFVAEMQTLRRKKRAAVAYGTRSLKGVRP